MTTIVGHTWNKANRIAIGAFVLFISTQLFSAESSPQVTLNASNAGPRTVETLTQRAIARDYKFAWTNLNSALETNSADPINGLFAGTANARLIAAVKNQQRTGVTSRYVNQTHKVEAVFYAPEGDVIELHDTAEYDLEISDGDKTIHSEHAIVNYVVLMTPGADRWVIRQLQAVARF
jgi:hypothetical protein